MTRRTLVGMVTLLIPAAVLVAQRLPLALPPARPVYKLPTADKPIEEADLDGLIRQCFDRVRDIKPAPPPPPPATAAADGPAAILVRGRSTGEAPRDLRWLIAEYTRRAREGSVDAEFARRFSLQVLSTQMLAEWWMDDAPYVIGLRPEDPLNDAMRGGRFERYHSDVARNAWTAEDGVMGMSAGIALQMLDAFPEAHEQYRKRVAPDDAVVSFTDTPPKLDGKPDENYCEVTGHVLFAADPTSLYIYIDKPRDKSCTLTIYDTPEKGEHYCRIQILPAEAAMTNAKGQPVTVYPRYEPMGTELQVPWSILKGQADWMTGIEHARGRVVVDIEDGEKMERTFYMLSTPERMKQRLLMISEATILNHADLIKKYGYLPVAIADRGAPGAPGATDAREKTPSERASFDLLATIMQYRNYQQHKRDWESMRAPPSGGK